jgi:hypothetical protein
MWSDTEPAGLLSQSGRPSVTLGGDAGEAFGLPVPALFDASLSDDRVDAGDALRPVWCRPPFRDLILREPGCGPHLNKKALAVARRHPLLDSIEGTG